MRLLPAVGAVALLAVAAASAKPGPPAPTESAVVETGRAPCGLAVHGRELWVGVYDEGVVLRLDSAGRVARRHRVGPWACRIAVGENAAWVTRDRANAVVRIDLASGRLRTIRISSPFDVVRAAGSVWATSFDTGSVARIDPRTARRTQTFRIGGHPAGVAWCGGYVWVGHGRAATWLTAIDPRTGRTRRADVVVPAPGWPRCLRGELWVTTPDAVLRVASRSGELLSALPLDGTPAEAGAAPGAVDGDWMIWVTDKEHSRVYRVDPATGFVDTFPAGPGAYALARFGGSMWITSFAGTDVRRFDP